MKIIDNINSLWGDDLKNSIKPESKLCVAASCFSIYAFEALRKELKGIDALEFIFSSPTFIPSQATDPLKKEKREFFIPTGSDKNVHSSEFEIQLRNKLTQKAIAKECAEWIRQKARFKSNQTGAPMQQFACITHDSTESIYMPLQGFTAVDLGYQKGNAFSNLINRLDDPSFTKTYLSLFDQIWRDQTKVQEVTQQVIEHLESVYQENSPERIYFHMLYNLFYDFLEEVNEDNLPNDRTGYLDSLVWKKLFNFQRDAASGIINKLESYSGCILADSVGLGKTFTALAVIKYYELRNKSVLVLCPKKLADNWLTYNRNLTTNIFAKDRFSYDVLCHTDLSRETGESLGMPLSKVNWSNYDLVVIDESHNFRNNDALKDRETRYQKLLNKVIKQGVKTKVLMLSATPVNNRFGDLKNQLALAYEGDQANLVDKLDVEQDIETIFKRAQTAFNAWTKLPAEQRTTQAILNSLDYDFFALLDSVTIARSRKHIETFYDTTDIGKFPERKKPISFHCPITTRSDVMGFNKIYAHLSQLALSVYAPMSYVYASRLSLYEDMYDTQVQGGKGRLSQKDRERSLQALMTTNLLKRLESSVHAFRSTLEVLLVNLNQTINKIEDYELSPTNTLSEPVGQLIDSDIDDDIDFSDDESIGSKIRIRLEDIDLPRWKQSLIEDRGIIETLVREMHKVSPQDDHKLQHLIAHISQKVEHPLNAGNKKVIVFTAYADTANYLFQHVSSAIQAKFDLHTAVVTGSDNPKSTLRSVMHSQRGFDFQSILTLFSPRSKEKDKVLPKETGEIDIMIGTDCISEGQNLQDCDYLINYDIHWNPVRIIQRFGRVDRIGSPNQYIQLVNYWPDISLDEYINLKERVENRMIIVDVTATGDDNVLGAKANDIAYRKDQLKKLQEEVIDMEDVKTGVSITDLGLNDFRMDLLNYVKAHPDIAKLPNGLHSVVPENPAIGLVPGVIFTLKSLQFSAEGKQQNRLYPYYLIYLTNDGEVVTDYTQVKKLLDFARSACKHQLHPISEAYEPFNRRTKDGADMTEYSAILEQAIRHIMNLKELHEIDSLFGAGGFGGSSSAFSNQLQGLDDFELISFLVIQGNDA
jgi:SNF2 family DNA or RNA helicase